MNRLLSSQSSAQAVRMGLQRVTHCIFDMDGLLLDTESLYVTVTQNIIDEFGKTYTWDVKAQLMGLQREEVAKRLCEIYDLPITPDEYMERAQIQVNLIMQDCKLLPDTEPIYENVIRDIAQSYDKLYPMDVRMKILGTNELRTCEIAVNDLNLPITVDEFYSKFRLLCDKRFGDCKLLEGAEKLLRHLHAYKVPICLATSSAEDSVELKTKNHTELFTLFHHKVCGSTDPDVKEGKPAPDIFLVAASRFDPKAIPKDCLVFEDSPNGVNAAHSAGMQVVMVPDPRVTEEQRVNATQVLTTLENFQPELFGLPPY